MDVMKKSTFALLLLTISFSGSCQLEGTWYLKTDASAGAPSINKDEVLSYVLYPDSSAVWHPKDKMYYCSEFNFNLNGTYTFSSAPVPNNAGTIRAKKKGVIPASVVGAGTWKFVNNLLVLDPDGSIVPPLFQYRIEWVNPNEVKLYQLM